MKPKIGTWKSSLLSVWLSQGLFQVEGRAEVEEDSMKFGSNIYCFDVCMPMRFLSYRYKQTLFSFLSLSVHFCLIFPCNSIELWEYVSSLKSPHKEKTTRVLICYLNMWWDGFACGSWLPCVGLQCICLFVSFLTMLYLKHLRLNMCSTTLLYFQLYKT